MQALVIIPARYDSERLPGKPILENARKITGKYIIQHVYERALSAELVEEVVVATDDTRIFEVVKSFGGKAQMTSTAHRSGTDRIAEVASNMPHPIIVNVQGDEPEITPKQINKVIHLLEDDPDADMGTLAHEITDTATYLDPDSVKAVRDNNGNALYFSRSPIPYVRGDTPKWMGESSYKALKHLGIYSYRRDFLLEFSQMPVAQLESAEKLEQLRALQAGKRIKIAITDTPSLGIDTEEDLHRWLKKFQ